MNFVTGCETSVPGDYCAVAPDLTPKKEVFTEIEAKDPVFAEQIYQHWVLLDDCE